MSMAPRSSLAAATSPGSLYGWVIVAIAFLAMALVLGSRFTMGMFIPYLPLAFDASAADISAALAISMIGAGVLQPFAGILLDRWGGRVLLTLGLASGGLALCGTATANSLWQMTVFMGFGSSIAYAAISPVLASAIVINWFDDNRGAPLGVATSGTKVAMVILPPLLAWLILAFGWRTAMLSIGLAIWSLIPVVLLCLRPQGHNGTLASKATPPVTGMSLAKAIRTPGFWILAVILFANGQVMNLVFIHLPNYVLSSGYSEAMAALALAFLGAVGVCGTVVTGMLSDRIGSRLMLLIMFGARAVTAILVVVWPGPASLGVFVLVFGLLGYGAIGVIGSLAAALFGKRQIGTILGSVYVFNQMGGAAGVYSGGLSYDLTGGYAAALWLSIGTSLISVAVIVLLRRERQYMQPQAEETTRPQQRLVR